MRLQISEIMLTRRLNVSNLIIRDRILLYRILIKIGKSRFIIMTILKEPMFIYPTSKENCRENVSRTMM